MDYYKPLDSWRTQSGVIKALVLPLLFSNYTVKVFFFSWEKFHIGFFLRASKLYLNYYSLVYDVKNLFVSSYVNKYFCSAYEYPLYLIYKFYNILDLYHSLYVNIIVIFQNVLKTSF